MPKHQSQSQSTYETSEPKAHVAGLEDPVDGRGQSHSGRDEPVRHAKHGVSVAYAVRPY